MGKTVKKTFKRKSRKLQIICLNYQKGRRVTFIITFNSRKFYMSVVVTEIWSSFGFIAFAKRWGWFSV